MKIAFEGFELDIATRLLRRGEEEVHLTPKAFELLRTLVEARPDAVSKQRLQEALWPETFVSEGNLSVLVAEIRRALGDDAGHPRFVRTVPRYGYSFVAATATPTPGPARRAGEGGHWLLWGRRKFALADGELLVGRDPGCQICLDQQGVSRRHARVSVLGPRATLEDLGSKNGTKRAGVAISGAVVLEDHDRLELGPVLLVYRYRPVPESTLALDELPDG